MNRASIGDQIGRALNIYGVLNRGIERHHANGSARGYGGRGLNADREIIGHQIAHDGRGNGGNRDGNGLRGEINVHRGRGRQARLHFRRQVGIEGIDCNLLLVRVGGADRKAGGGCQHC